MIPIRRMAAGDAMLAGNGLYTARYAFKQTGDLGGGKIGKRLLPAYPTLYFYDDEPYLSAVISGRS